MRVKLKDVQGLEWFDGAVMNAEWRGPKLRDVLMKAGINPDESNGHKGDASTNKTLHVQFFCHAVETQEDSYYGASIPLERAMNDGADVVLAMEVRQLSNTLPILAC